MALPTGFAGQVGQGLKGVEVVGPAVGITRVVDSIHPQHQPFGSASLRQAEAHGDEHGVAPGHIGGRNAALLNAMGGDRDAGVGEG